MGDPVSGDERHDEYHRKHADDLHEGHGGDVRLLDLLAHEDHLRQAAGDAAQDAARQTDVRPQVGKVSHSHAEQDGQGRDRRHQGKVGDHLLGGFTDHGPSHGIPDDDQSHIAKMNRPAGAIAAAGIVDQGDCERSKHPWQREMQKMKQESAGNRDETCGED